MGKEVVICSPVRSPISAFGGSLKAVRDNRSHGSCHHFKLRFRSLLDETKEIICPCDASGYVDMDELGERARTSYLFARATVGRLYATPEVVAALHGEMSFT